LSEIRKRILMNYKTMFAIILIFPSLAAMTCVSAAQGNNDVDPDSICGIWENRKEGAWFFSKGTFSWGENVYSTDSLIIDLNSKEWQGPYISFDHNVFFVHEKKAVGKTVILTGYYNYEENERKEVIITVIDENTISIELVGKYSGWWLNDFFLRPENPNNYFYRVPVDTPHKPLPRENT